MSSTVTTNWLMTNAILKNLMNWNSRKPMLHKHRNACIVRRLLLNQMVTGSIPLRGILRKCFLLWTWVDLIFVSGFGGQKLKEICHMYICVDLYVYWHQGVIVNRFHHCASSIFCFQFSVKLCLVMGKYYST